MIGIINYGAGNLQSVANALKKLDEEFMLINQTSDFELVDKVILPGVGAAGYAMQRLSELGLVEIIKDLKVPFLGICLGLQVLSNYSEEGDVGCLDIIPGKVKKFEQGVLKVPQIGWNRVNFIKASALFEGIENGQFFYFVNSYYFAENDENIFAVTKYGVNFASVVQKNNFHGVQFHPEKSGEVGLQLLNNFCKKC